MVKIQCPQVFGLALDRLAKLSANEELRERIRKAEKYEMDRLSDLDDSWEDGMEKGMEKGIVKKAFEIAQKMLSKNESIDNIIEYTGLTVDEIISIKNA